MKFIWLYTLYTCYIINKHQCNIQTLFCKNNNYNMINKYFWSVFVSISMSYYILISMRYSLSSAFIGGPQSRIWGVRSWGLDPRNYFYHGIEMYFEKKMYVDYNFLVPPEINSWYGKKNTYAVVRIFHYNFVSKSQHVLPCNSTRLLTIFIFFLQKNTA